MKTLAGITVVILVTLVSCGIGEPRMESVTGTVTATNWNSPRTVIVEQNGGYLKSLTPICTLSAIPVWPGMKAEMAFHWDSYYECFIIDAARELK